MQEIEVVDDGSVLTVHHHPLMRVVMTVLALGFVGLGAESVRWFATTRSATDLLWAPVLVVMAWWVLRYAVDSVTVGHDAVRLRRLGAVGTRTRTVPLADIESAVSGYDGLSLHLVLEDPDDWPATTLTSTVLQTWNLRRWLGRPGRSDRVCAIIEHRAARARGEDPGPIVLHRRRGVGAWAAAAWAALVQLRA